MKLQALLSLALFVPMPVFAQQTNIYQVCTTYQENYAPGSYDQYGNYRQGNVSTQAYNTQCGTGTYYRPNNAVAAPYYASPVTQPVAQPRRTCAAAALGAIGGGYAAYRATNYVPNRWWAVPLGAVTGGIIGNGVCNYMYNR